LPEKRPTKDFGLILSKQRLETLIDGIFAIAMTLLVINLFIPRDSAPTALGKILFEQLSGFYAYIISFLLLASFWVAHHRQFHYIKHTDNTHIWINVFMLLFIALTPFSASTLANYLSLTADLFFAVNLMALGLILLANWVYVAKRLALTETLLDKDIYKKNIRRAMVVPVVAALVMVLSIFFPERSFYGYIIIFIVLLTPPFRNK
jgi:uncharacterized membrane protein